jgi:hypothetical protein
MDAVYEALYWVHVPMALSNLPAFWIALLARKGGRLHRRVGGWFGFAMLFTATTGAIMGLLRLSYPSIRGIPEAPDAERVFGVFLLYLGSITGIPVLHGVRLARRRVRPERVGDGLHRLLLPLPAAMSLALVAVTLAWMPPAYPILLAMSPVGFVVTLLSSRDLAKYRRRPAHWRAAHASAMLIGGIALHTAASLFLVNGLLDLNPRGLASILQWTGPILLFVPAILWIRLRERRSAPDRGPTA